MSPINFLILLGTVFASFAAVPVFSQGNVTVISNNGKMIVNWASLGNNGQGDPTKDTYFIRTCGDVSTLAKTEDLYYTVKMGVFTDYILPKAFLDKMYKDTCMTIAGNSVSCSPYGDCQPFMYSPYDPSDVDKFKIEDVVVDVKYTPFLYGSSQKGITKDGRKSISAWGSHSDYSDIGGCCKATNDPKEVEWWYKPYTLTATPLNMSYLYLHAPKLSGVLPHFTINSKVTDIYTISDSSEIDVSCTWEIKNVATGTSVTATAVGCILTTDVTADKAADTNYSVTVSIKPLTGKVNKVLWRTNSATATAYIVVPKSGITTTTTTASTTTATTTAATTTTASATTAATTTASATTASTTTASTTTTSTTNTATTTAAPTRPTTPTPSGSLATTSATVKKESKSNGTTLIIVGCVIAVIVIIGIIFLAVFLCRKVKKAKKIAGFEP